MAEIWKKIIPGWGKEKNNAKREVASNLPYETYKWKDQPNQHYATNQIKTTKYTLLSFVPKNLFEQFHRFANLYFVGVAALNFVPVVNAFQPAVAVIPICIILAITALKDAWEDFRRYKSDKTINNMGCLVYSRTEHSYVEKCWQEVRVGDFVKLVCNEIIPADILLLYSSDQSGICHIETANLDGETNLKQRQVVRGFFNQGAMFDPESFNDIIICEKPNNNLNKFKGYIRDQLDQRRMGFNNESLLLRGCTVRNTEEVIGIVVYAGHETKSMLNNSGPRYKRSKIERRMNTDVLFCVGILFLMCFAGALGHGLWVTLFSTPPPFDVPDGNFNYLPAPLAGFYMFLTMIILLQTLIPISLYVSIELVKIGQIFFIHNDLDLYDEEIDLSVQCRALNITEDLGQIQYIFSDKTGTLTENKMVFRRCSIAGNEFSHQENAKRLELHKDPDSDDEDMSKIRNFSVGDLDFGTVSSARHPNKHLRRCQSARARFQGHYRKKSDGRFEVPTSEVAFSSPMEKDVTPDGMLLKKVQEAALHIERQISLEPAKSSTPCSPVADFFLALALCNTVVVSTATEPRQRVMGPSMLKSSVTSMEKIQIFVQKLKQFRLSQSSFRSTAANIGSTFSHKNNTVTPTASDSSLKDTVSCPSQGEAEASSNSMDDSSSKSRETCVEDPGASLDDAQLVPEFCYEAESPDEAALVHAARAYSFTLMSRTPEQVTVRLPEGTLLTFELLYTLGFDSVRKRMSVVVRHPITKEIIVYTKGADSVIMDLLENPSRCTMENQKKMEKIWSKTQRHLDLYARDGLRTLCIAKKVLSEADFQKWSNYRQEAEAAIENREELLVETAHHLETRLSLLGATGIEDRLQDGVPDTIASLREAGIQIWVLTGDKQETAVNIAYSCHLLGQNDTVFTINTESKETCESILDCTIDEVKKFCVPKKKRGLFQRRENASSVGPMRCGPHIGLVIDGRTLSVIFQGGLEKKLLALTSCCRSVLCCRATPLQKSMVVNLVRDKLKVMTLSIGDGANDVSMIQAADIGIGISGQEGMQAVMSSDFAISRFMHLKKLLLVHGHWCYARLAKMVLYFFYKNVAYINLLFWFQFFCGFSGTTMIDYWQLIFFNLFFTSVPPLIFGILDQDVSAETLMNLPELYKTGQNSELYNPSTFWLAIMDAFYQSLVCFFIPFIVYRDSGIDLLSFGTPINTIALLTIILHLAIEIKTWTIIHCITIVISITAYFVIALGYNGVCVLCNSPSPYWIMEKQMSDPNFYFLCLITPIIALGPRYFITALCGTFALSPINRAQHLDKLSAAERELHIKEWKEESRRLTVLSDVENNWGAASGSVEDSHALPTIPEKELPGCSYSLKPEDDNCNSINVHVAEASDGPSCSSVRPSPRPMHGMVAPERARQRHGPDGLLNDNTDNLSGSSHRRSISVITV